MRKNKLVRNLGFLALVVVALGMVGYLAGGGEGDEALRSGSLGGGDPFGVEDEDVEGRAVASTGSGGSVAPVAPAPGEAPLRDTVGKNAASEAKGAPGAANNGVPALQSSIDRKIVQTGSIQLQVREVGSSFEEVGRIATASGGFVASSSFSYKGEQQIASVTIRVPTERYQGVLSELRSLGVKVDAEDSKANDVTEEYTDLTSRLRTLEATQDQLLQLLARATSITDILTVQDRLNNVTGQIEQVKGRMQLLDNLADLATITVHLRPEAAAAKVSGGDGRVDLGEKLSEAWDDSLDFLSEVAGGVITAVVFVWWVPLVAVPLAVLWALFGRNRGPTMRAVD